MIPYSDESRPLTGVFARSQVQLGNEGTSLRGNLSRAGHASAAIAGTPINSSVLEE